ncbi:MAG TPA: ABC transporter substrate-binding protein [Vicinamibacterales bacterium]|nr:ABC transporter substrate-binding protein [Vicinamibacterales bacterium]HPW22017.1 ABC transporter substrate-binding protein [Vicinamibacterales bacterium]
MTRAGRLLISLALVGTAATTSVPRGRHFARLAGPVSVPAEAAAATPAATPAAPLAAPAQTAVRPRRGGSLVATLRSEPRTLNPLTGRDFASTLVASLTHARLLRINRATQQLEPWLAESYACSADGLSCTLKLRRGVTFSDGAPFTSADVVFSFRAVYDEKTGSPLGDVMLVGGKPIAAAAPDAHTVALTFPAPFGPGLRLLDSLPIVPRHKLEAALGAGTLREQWGPAAPPAQIAGLGPFVLQEYRAGERLVLARNPRYWRADASGTRLPYLDRLTLEITPDQNAELLRLQSGQADLTQSEVRPDDYAALRRAAAAGTLRLADAGLAFDADAFWINLRPGAKAHQGRPWLARVELRRAISHAVNRRAFADEVFLGAAEPLWGPVPPSNAAWYAPEGAIERQAYDPARAQALLAGLGLRDANRDGMLEDASGAPARFALVTQKGNTALEKGAAFLRDELRKVGLGVDVVPLEVGSLVDRMTKGDYDALYFRFLTSDTDPAMNLDFWLSSGGAHVWNMEQPSPATPWEQEIDTLVLKMAAERAPAERRRLFIQAQKVLADNLPVIYFAVPRVFVATSTRVAGAVPAPVRPPVLWNADAIGASR